MVVAMERNHTAPKPSKNGGKPVLRLGDLVPEHLEIELNGRMIKAWMVSNQRYPVSMAAELEDLRQTYLQSREVINSDEPDDKLVRAVEATLAAYETDGTVSIASDLDNLKQALNVFRTEPRYRVKATAWENYVSSVLMLLLPGLEEWEADMMGTDMRLKVLSAVGYFQGDDEGQDSGEVTEPTEQETSTGDEPLPVLLGTTG